MFCTLLTYYYLVILYMHIIITSITLEYLVSIECILLKYSYVVNIRARTTDNIYIYI